MENQRKQNKKYIYIQLGGKNKWIKILFFSFFVANNFEFFVVLTQTFNENITIATTKTKKFLL